MFNAGATTSSIGMVMLRYPSSTSLRSAGQYAPQVSE